MHKNRWVYSFDNGDKDIELINNAFSFINNNNKITEIGLKISGVKYNIQKEYKCIKDYYDEKFIYIPINNKNIEVNKYEEDIDKDYILNAFTITIVPFSKLKCYKNFDQILLSNNLGHLSSFYTIIIKNNGIYLKINKKMFTLNFKWLCKFLNLLWNENLRTSILNFIFDIIGDDTYLIKDIKRYVEKSAFCLNIDINDLSKYHNFKEMFLHKYKKILNINYNKYNVNLCYMLIRTYSIIEEKHLQIYINDLKNNFNKFTNYDLLVYNYNNKYNLLYKILYKIYFEKIDYDGTYSSDLNDYINLCKNNKTKINIKQVKNRLKMLHDIEVEKSMKKEQHRRKKNVFNFEKSKFADLIKNMPQKYNLIKNEYELWVEGTEQHNCVYSYLYNILRDKCIIYNYISNENHYTIEIRKHYNKYKLCQMRAKFNEPPKTEDYEEVENCLNNINKKILKK